MLAVLAVLALAPQGTSLGAGERFWQSQAVDGDRFGASIAVDGDSVLVGAPEKDNNPASTSGYGVAYVFHRQGGAWVEDAVLQELNANIASGDGFGSAVALQGDLALVGAPGVDALGPSTNSGAVVIFERSMQSAWSRTGRIVPTGVGPQDFFGASLALEGEHLVVSAPFDDDRGQDAGAAYAFRNVGGAWLEESKIVAPDGAPGDLFGLPRLEGDWLIIGAFEASHALGLRAGAVYVFRRAATGWSFHQKLVASNGSAGDRFGASLALSDGVLAVGATHAGPSSGNLGLVYVFELGSGGNWIEVQQLTSPEMGNAGQFGFSVAISRDRMAVGDPFALNDFGNGNRRYGVMHFYERTASGWVHTSEILETALEPNDEFGHAIAMAPGRVVVGAPNGGALGGSNGGTAWAYPLTEVFQRYCDPAVATTAGVPAELDAQGSSYVVDNDLRLRCTEMPLNVFGYFIAGDQLAFVPGAGGSFGDLCVGGQVLRFNDVIPSSGQMGTIERAIDLTQVPVIGAFSAGAPWYFQAWFRDGSRSNFSNAVIVPFR